MDEARFRVCSVEKTLHSKCKASVSIGNAMRCIAQLFTRFKATFNQALTQMANCERRVTFAAKRVRSLKGKKGNCICDGVSLSPTPSAATLGCRQALAASKLAGRSDAQCQARGGPEGVSDEEEEWEGLMVSTPSRERLQVEVETLCQERDNLISQLGESTEEFQKQLKSVKDKCNIML